jgi:CRISPR-associated protein Csb2
MASYYTISIRFLDPCFHGRRDGGKPEWPPSPLRLFQALVAAAARQDSGDLTAAAAAALKWLESKSTESPPIILAPMGAPADFGYRISVPNNAMDIVAKAWCRGNYSNAGDANPATHRTMKNVRAVHVREGDTIYFVWTLPLPPADEDRHYAEVLATMAHSIASLGWGVDMAVGDASIMTEGQVSALPGERWLPSSETSSDGLRVPVTGTLNDLIARHKGFLKRMKANVFTPPPTLTVFKKVRYRRAFDPPIRHVAAFSLLKSDANGFRSFDTVRKALTVAGMTRHAAACAAERGRLSKAWINGFILGHGELRGHGEHISVNNRRFAFLPLPSIEARGGGQAPVVGNVRRVMLTVFDGGCEEEIDWACKALSGQSLQPDCDSGQEASENTINSLSILSLLPVTDNVVEAYTRKSTTWATVTPVVLPGYDDPAHYRDRLEKGAASDEQKRLLAHLNKRIDGLLRKSIFQAGFSKALAENAEIEWRKVGFWRGNDLADRYGVPDHLKRFSRYHVRILWRNESKQPVSINGPICIGGGRFYGLGLFAAL